MSETVIDYNGAIKMGENAIAALQKLVDILKHQAGTAASPKSEKEPEGVKEAKAEPELSAEQVRSILIYFAQNAGPVTNRKALDQNNVASLKDCPKDKLSSVFGNAVHNFMQWRVENGKSEEDTKAEMLSLGKTNGIEDLISWVIPF